VEVAPICVTDLTLAFGRCIVYIVVLIKYLPNIKDKCKKQGSRMCNAFSRLLCAIGDQDSANYSLASREIATALTDMNKYGL
jgi:hypothetical protein